MANMKGIGLVTQAVVLTVVAVAGATLGCSKSQPLTPSQPTAAVQSGQSGSMSANEDSHESLSAATLQELAQARNATAKYHDVAVALADGYVQGPYRPGEGYHFIKVSLRDCTFDLEHPEVLVYIASDRGMKLVGVEYQVPTTCPAMAREGFTGDADEWELEGPNWALVAWLWLGNPNGIFAEPPHPQIPLVPQ